MKELPVASLVKLALGSKSGRGKKVVARILMFQSSFLLSNIACSIPISKLFHVCVCVLVK